MPSTISAFLLALFLISSPPEDQLTNQISLPSIADEIERIIDTQGISKAVTSYETLKNEKGNQFDFTYKQLQILGLKLLKNNKPDEAITLLELNVNAFPENPDGYRTLARAYLNIGERKKSIKCINQAMAVDPLSLPTIILKKRLLLVPEDFNVPETKEVEEFRIRPLTAADVDLDYQAVISSKNHLQGVLGRPDWPGDLTWEEDLWALEMHEQEFKERTGFVYTVVNHEETICLGCIYIYPSRLDDHDAEIIMWVTSDSFEKGLDSLLFQTVKNWMTEEWPFENVLYTGREIKWGKFFQLLGEQDRKYH